METNNDDLVITQIDDSESGEERFSVELDGFKLILIVVDRLEQFSDDEIEDIVGTISKAE